MDKIVQYVIVRSDLGGAMKWPLGAVIAQCCHATTAVGHMFRDDPITQMYFADLNNMHKVVLKVDNEEALQELSETLQAADILHKMWIEMPENIPTCIALKPYQKQEVQKYLKKYKMY